MTTGIYLLKFADGLEYVGQAIDIEKRWEQHKSNMLANKAAAKMQHAFKTCGFPEMEIVIECHKDNLDILEGYFIQLLRPALNTVLNGMYSDVELSIIERNMDLVKLSTTQLLDAYNKLEAAMNICAEQAKALEEGMVELDEARTASSMAIGAVRELQELKTLHEQEIDSLESEIELLTSRLECAERPWWRKIF